MPLRILFEQLLLEGGRFSLIAMAVALMLSVSRHFDLLLGIPALLGAYIGVSRNGTVTALGVVTALVVAGAAGAGAASMLFRSDGSERFSGTARLLLSLSLLILGENVVSIVAGDQPLIAVIFPNTSWLGMSAQRLVVLFLSAAASTVLLLAMRHTSAGLRVRAVRSDPVLAVASGVSVRRIAVMVIAAAFMLASLGGIATALDVAATPGFAFTYLLMGIVAAVVGGSSRLGGAIAGAFVVSGCRSAATWYMGAEWSDSIAFFILVGLALATGTAGRTGVRHFFLRRPPGAYGPVLP